MFRAEGQSREPRIGYDSQSRSQDPSVARWNAPPGLVSANALIRDGAGRTAVLA
jgi:hypothetical protein